MSFIIEDRNGGKWLPAYTGFNKVMGKNAMVVPFQCVFIDGEWYECGTIDVAREAYPVRPLDIVEWMTNPPEVVEEDEVDEED